MSVQHLSATRRIYLLLIGLVLTLTGCERTLVYGERTGFNLGISVTPAENLPIDVNAGLKRRVVGIIPPGGEQKEGKVDGEAVNMFSRFDLQHETSTVGVFFGTHTVSTAFASGGAATAIAGLDPEDARKVVAAIVEPEVITLDNSPEAAKVRKELTAYIKGSPEAVAEYKAVAQGRGVPFDETIPPPLAALTAIADPKNANENFAIAVQLGLLN